MKRALLVALLLLCACSKSAAGGAPASDDAGAKSLDIAGTLAVDIRQSVAITITPVGALEMIFGDGDFGLFPAGTKLRGRAVTERFTEASMVLYTATLASPARASSMCGSQPITLMLSLSRRGSNARVGGALTAYCADAKVPARVLRLTGDLPLPAPASG